jgi:hypothetical protein
MSDEKPKCPYCSGNGIRGVEYREMLVNGSKAIQSVATPCWCHQNKVIRQRFPMLGPLPDATAEDSESAHKLCGTGNLKLVGTESKFLYLVKSFMLKDIHKRDYELTDGARIVEQYQAHDKDEVWKTVTALNNPDLLILMCTSQMDYKSIRACVADVVNNRMRRAKATWVYASTTDLLAKSKEYSAELENMLKSFGVPMDVDVSFGCKGMGTGQEARATVKRNLNEKFANIG